MADDLPEVTEEDESDNVHSLAVMIPEAMAGDVQLLIELLTYEL